MLAHGLTELGIKPSAAILDRFTRYAQLLTEWNAKFNLTRIPPENFDSLHFLDSLQIARAVDLDAPKTVVDLGSGAGFPGVPLAVVFPTLGITLIESNLKKIKFLNELVLRLDLRNVSIVHGRAEKLSEDSNQRNRYDLVLARAVAPLELLLGLVAPFLKADGLAILHKGAGVEDEAKLAAKRLSQLNLQLLKIVNYSLDQRSQGRLVVVKVAG